MNSARTQRVECVGFPLLLSLPCRPLILKRILLQLANIDISKSFYIIRCMSHYQIHDVANILKSIADDTRLSILRKLVEEKCEVASSEIVGSCSEFHKLSQPAMSHHFQKLVNSGVLRERKVGVEKYYMLNKDTLNSIGIDVEKL